LTRAVIKSYVVNGERFDTSIVVRANEVRSDWGVTGFDALGETDFAYFIDLKPDVLLFDGQGIAHPRGLGLASHMGLLLDRPSVGCAKSVLVGGYDPVGVEAGSYSYLLYKGKRVGAAVRTRSRVKPVFVSPGHRINLPSSIKIVLRSCRGYRLPEPLRQAHNLVSQLRSVSEGKYTIK